MTRNIARDALLFDMKRRAELHKLAGNELFFAETWEIEMLINPELAKITNDSSVEGTAQLLVFGMDHTKRSPVRVANPEQFVSDLDCNAVTEEFTP